ncbi:hypothetical protein [Curtobacterium sp. MCSS17_007]|uniref:hypothetical protein n=1 Tax=Curtobacterium sp. MCSS17_007 TaxID=2175646 RepID=UPI000DA7990A|nr:hypothetical protein [Curtobacterium sp. MCSS17_007]WIE74785.1 hypothetical protein DEJ22_011025 [Curtobacterium sp. MCSS17_007]
MAVQDPTEAFIERDDERWRQQVRRRYRFRPRKARRIIRLHDDTQLWLEELRAVRRERARLIEAGELQVDR